MTSTTPSPHQPIAERILDGYTAVGAPALSPDGRWAAVTVTRLHLADNEYRSRVWLVPTDGSVAARPVTNGAHDGEPVWSPDGRALAFTGQRGEQARERTLHVLPIAEPGEVQTVATMRDGLGDLAWSPDGRWLAFTSRTPDPRYEHDEERWQAPRRVDRFFSRLDSVGWTIDRPSHVHVVAADGSGPPRNLTPGPWEHHGVAWLADSSGVITAAGRHDTWDLDLAADLHLVPLTGDIEVLTDTAAILGNPSVSPDGTRVAFLGHDDPMTDPQNARVGILDLATRTRRWVSEGLDRTFVPTSGARPPVWEDDRHVLAVAEDRGRAQVMRVAVTGDIAPDPLTSGDQWVRAVDARAGTIVAAVAWVDRPAELVRIDGGEPRRLTHVTDAYVAAAAPQGWERFTVPSTDGTVEIDAWIMRPVDFDPAQRYPVLLNVHGGPHTQYGETYFDEAQVQAAAGFVVVMSNPRGSSGREEAWGQAIIGPKHPVRPGTGWGGADVEDVLAVLDAALERYPFGDPERVGMLGGSYGGWMATYLAGRHGDRFRAICTERAVNNLLAEDWSSDIATVFRVEHGANPVEDPDELMRMSPIRFAKDIEVPVLIIHSEQDLRCPINQAEELFVTLRLLGKDVVFYRFPGESHELTRSGSPVHRRQRAEIVLDWFAQHLAAAPD